jgi:hypothetical protein
VTGRVLAAGGRAPEVEPVVAVAAAVDPPGAVEAAPATGPVAADGRVEAAPVEAAPVDAAPVEAGFEGGGGAGRAVDG